MTDTGGSQPTVGRRKFSVEEILARISYSQPYGIRDLEQICDDPTGLRQRLLRLHQSSHDR